MRAGPLSDDQVIQVVNEFFVPIEINITRDGFPVDAIPAMKYYQHVFQSNWRFEFGFASSSVVDDTGKIPLGLARPKGSTLSEYMNNRHYLDFVVTSLERFKRLQLAKRSMFLGDFATGGQQIGMIIQELIQEAVGDAAKMQEFQRQLFTPESGIGEISKSYSP